MSQYPVGDPNSGQFAAPATPGQPMTPGYPIGAPTPSAQPKSSQDLVAAIAGVLAFLCSFISYYQFTVITISGDQAVSLSAWHGFFGWFGCLLALVAGALAAASYMQMVPSATAKNARLGVVGLFGLSTLFIFISLFVTVNATITILGQQMTVNDLFNMFGSVNMAGTGAIGALVWSVLGLIMAILSMRKASKEAALAPGYAAGPTDPQAWNPTGQPPYGTPSATPASPAWPPQAPTSI